ncbi:class I SAM-dependent methyltransferase [Kordiimonas marina]|uniref:class I SAM-dependent methyltransferase n=1 Tax=Kordiimonas marina TaxID=2872312 RepID=UPI001FF6763F|nr:hypothetical protein [Kordiimonas marina]MCJ9429153.1 hypothetical protein [Kordiimonas marina]
MFQAPIRKFTRLSAGVAAGVTLALSLALAGQVQADEVTDPVQAAIDSPDRPAIDKQRDAARKPAAIIKFAGIKPGMTVLDVNSATGWYTELFSRVVGPDGTVYAHNGPAYLGFMKGNVGPRYDDGRLPNVIQLRSTSSENFDLPEDTVDVAMMTLVYHDYFAGAHGPIAPILASLHKVMKPGGAVVIVDHVAKAGSGEHAGDEYHRIDPALVKKQMEAAGFKFAGESDVLRNPDDDHMSKPWAKAIRGHTDRFVYKFVK